MSPTTRPSGCADKSNCMIRSRGSVPIAENISAYFATRSARFLLVPPSIFLCLQKYGCLSTLNAARSKTSHFEKHAPPIPLVHLPVDPPRPVTSNPGRFQACTEDGARQLNAIRMGLCRTGESETAKIHLSVRVFAARVSWSPP